MGFVAQPLVHGVNAPVLLDLRVDRLRADRLHSGRDGADRIMAYLWADDPGKGELVGQDIAHAAHSRKGGGAHALERCSRIACLCKILNKFDEASLVTVAGKELAGNAAFVDDVGIVLCAVNALVDGQIQFHPVVPNLLIRLDDGQGQRQAVVFQCAGEVGALGIGQQDQSPSRPDSPRCSRPQGFQYFAG